MFFSLSFLFVIANTDEYLRRFFARLFIYEKGGKMDTKIFEFLKGGSPTEIVSSLLA